MNVALAKDATRATHVLRSNPDTIHWGYFDGALAPVLSIDSGDRVAIECVSGNPEWMPPKSAGFEVLPELQDIHQRVKRGSGCEKCRKTGYFGRAATFEVIDVTDRIRVMIRDGADENDVVRAARKDGAEPLMSNAVRKLLAGRTTADEILRVIPATW